MRVSKTERHWLALGPAHIPPRYFPGVFAKGLVTIDLKLTDAGRAIVAEGMPS